MSRLLAIWLAAGAALPGSTAKAADPPCVTVAGNRVDAVLENDTKAFDLVHQSDDEYTNGVRVAWSHMMQSGSAGPFHTVWPFRERVDRCFEVSLAFGQSLYTPRNLLTPARMLDDRPYAAWLYGSYTIAAYALTSETGARRGLKTLRAVDLNVGVIGPAANGEWAQNTAHRIFDVRVYPGGPLKIAQGWPNQLPNELGFFVEFRREDKRAEAFSGDTRYLDFVTTVRGAAGNVFAFAGAGGRARLGFGLHDAVVGRPTTISFKSLQTTPGGAPSWLSFLVPTEFYLFAATEGRFVLRNEFLDGTLFVDSPQSVQKNGLVGDFDFGTAIGWRAFKVTFRTVVRTSEYRLHPGNHYFGSLAVTVGRH